MRKYLLLAAGLAVISTACKKKPEGPDEFTKAFYAAGDLQNEDLELAADSFYSLYKNNPNYEDETRLRECLFISANWVYGKIGYEEDTAKQKQLMRKAVPRYAEFIEKYPNSPKVGQAYKELSYCLYELGEYEKCINICKQWITNPLGSTSEYLPFAYKYTGRSYTFLNKKDSAIVYLKEAYRLFDAQTYLSEAKAMKDDLAKLGVKNPD